MIFVVVVLWVLVCLFTQRLKLLRKKIKMSSRDGLFIGPVSETLASCTFLMSITAIIVTTKLIRGIVLRTLGIVTLFNRFQLLSSEGIHFIMMEQTCEFWFCNIKLRKTSLDVGYKCVNSANWMNNIEELHNHENGFTSCVVILSSLSSSFSFFLF